MKNILLINGHEYFPKSKGELNQTIFNEWNEVLSSDYEVKTTIVDEEYNVDQEIEKWQWADVIIMQTPIYWFSIPGNFKKYIDRVYMDKIFFIGSDRYGQGGMFTNKKYMFSLTWNAPEAAFGNEQSFFEGRNLDQAIDHLHKMNQYVGMRPLPTYSIHNVMKETNMAHYRTKLHDHYREVFGK
ncbi:NAD(P)H-dependent oxidoreductase [Guptibacillus spartinae]|uniref:NAD(P)H-dependent oxidoreductase n=1 Tax=Guptibacillus spartinae TaxID=3025679 RepID=UPI0023621BB8|nr:NAD(P)H-dependent oxidoreductase [Pseudalkalibacillus spartinae]